MSDGDAQGEVVTAPNVKWAQRKDRILLTIECENCEEPKLRIENVDDENDKFGKLSLAGQGTRNGKACAYDLNLEVFGELNKSDSKVSVSERKIVLVLLKSRSGPHWPRLLRAKGKSPANVKVDWDLYMDSDEEEEEEKKAQFDIGELDDFSKFDDPLDKDVHTDSDDSDDEDLPDLVK
ncbi:co-chaperone protein p23 [Chloropicon roscoffensis]|uniref:Co-chaperone protein p23 n=1 Tax=Chloropicon roscoffensis TaxID=1461544 RepID=A0AAX4PIU0_9CHLO